MRLVAEGLRVVVLVGLNGVSRRVRAGACAVGRGDSPALNMCWFLVCNNTIVE